jgi:membrane protein DedA with SNARE-associated domain
MPILRFTIFTFLGSLPWTALLVFAGMQLGANWEAVGTWLKRFEYLIVGVLVVIALAWIWLRIVKPRLAARAEA